MIAITGAAGFIGSCLVWKFNQEGLRDLLLVDELGSCEKWKNLQGKSFSDYLEKDVFLSRLERGDFAGKLKAVFHLGACSSTTETDASYLIENNYAYSQKLAGYALKNDLFFCYASSAATYGDGACGYSDEEAGLGKLRPLNMYGFSKHLFDLWLLRNGLLSKTLGFKFFNVFGPNEYHKGEMRSLICKAHDQIRETGKIRLFKSYHPGYADGEQKRDFVYVKDTVEWIYRFYEKRNVRGLFNLGSGQARTWNDLAKAIFKAMEKPVRIEYVDMPEAIRSKYQYFTQAEMQKVRRAGIDVSPRSLEEAIEDYVCHYLAAGAFL